jgi:hypothetical protein
MRALVAAIAASAALASPAAAETIELGWSEKAVAGGRTIMTFHVAALDVEAGRWSVRASFTNRSEETLAIRRRFGLALYRARADRRAFRVLRAAAYEPAPPARLAPGERWAGEFAGRGRLPAGALVRVRFGFFAGRAVPGWPGFWWLTDHAHRRR